MRIKIKVTKEILRESMMCSTSEFKLNETWKKNGKLHSSPSQNCAVALACQDIFPLCDMGYTRITNTWRMETNIDSKEWEIGVPIHVTRFIGDFDRLSGSPQKRLDLPELEFEIELTDKVIDALPINIDEAIKIINQSKTLELA